MTNLLTMSGCALKFGGLSAVNNFNLNLNEGELVGLIGPNGAGKTCVFNLLTGIYKPEIPAFAGMTKVRHPGESRDLPRHPEESEGSRAGIYFTGVDITKLPPFKINQIGIARTFQNIRLFNSLSVLENVRMGYHHYLKHGSLEAILRTRNYYIDRKS